jgi:hypothetical protein
VTPSGLVPANVARSTESPNAAEAGGRVVDDLVRAAFSDGLLEMVHAHDRIARLTIQQDH